MRTRFVLLRVLRLDQILELGLHGSQVGIDGFFKQGALQTLELLAALVKAPATMQSHLVRELCDLELFVFDLDGPLVQGLALRTDGLEQLTRQASQSLGIHLLESSYVGDHERQYDMPSSGPKLEHMPIDLYRETGSEWGPESSHAAATITPRDTRCHGNPSTRASN